MNFDVLATYWKVRWKYTFAIGFIPLVRERCCRTMYAQVVPDDLNRVRSSDHVINQTSIKRFQKVLVSVSVRSV